MARPDEEVAALLQEYADLISITGGEQYKARVYERAARSVGGYPEDVSTLDGGALKQVPNVGASIADKITEYLQTGSFAALEDLRAKIPSGVRRLMEIPTLAGRKIGVLVTDGVDAGLVADLRAAAAQEQANLEFVAPTVGGVDASDGSRIVADQKLDGGPSVLYDAVVILATKEGAALLTQLPAARDFVTDAYAHSKFIGYTDEATALFRVTGMAEMLDAGFVQLDGDRTAGDFVGQCRQLRYWERQLAPV